jgi:hypothetical protein
MFSGIWEFLGPLVAALLSKARYVSSIHTAIDFGIDFGAKNQDQNSSLARLIVITHRYSGDARSTNSPRSNNSGTKLGSGNSQPDVLQKETNSFTFLSSNLTLEQERRIEKSCIGRPESSPYPPPSLWTISVPWVCILFSILTRSQFIFCVKVANPLSAWGRAKSVPTISTST